VAGRVAVASKFNLCNASALDNARDRSLFAGDGVVYLPVQSNDPACDGEVRRYVRCGDVVRSWNGPLGTVLMLWTVVG
jgi:hypothetical protein